MKGMFLALGRLFAFICTELTVIAVLARDLVLLIVVWC